MNSNMRSSPNAAHLTSQPGDPPWEIAFLFPVQGSWTEDDYLELDTSRLVELSNGCVEVLPMPTILHQRIVRFLFLALHRFVADHSAGEVLFAPLPVRLWPEKFREPDLVYVREDRKEYRGRPEGADLLVEVVSEGDENRRRDLEIKRSEYARAGIGEYWIVDPEERQIVVLSLEGDTYREHGRFALGDSAMSLLLSGFEVAVSEVFAAGNADSD